MSDFFENSYIAAGGLTKNLDNIKINELLVLNKHYLDAKYRALADEITAKFNARKFEPEVCKLTTPLTLQTNVTEYKFTDYKVLYNTLLVDFCIPIYNSLTKYVNGQDILSAADLANCYITLVNDRQQTIVFREPIVDYFRDGAYWQGKGKFAEARMDWDTSKIEFADQAVVNANAGKVVVPVVSYIDMKRYPFVK